MAMEHEEEEEREETTAWVGVCVWWGRGEEGDRVTAWLAFTRL